MQDDTARQVIALLQQAGVLTPEAATQALEHDVMAENAILPILVTSGEVSLPALERALLHYGKLALQMSAVLDGLPVSAEHGTGFPERPSDELRINDQRLQDVLVSRGRLTPQQLDAAVQAQQSTGHPLWRTIINMNLLTPQEMTDMLTLYGATSASLQTPSVVSPTVDAGQPETALVSQEQRDRERRHVVVDETATAVQMVNAIFEGAVRARATDIHLEPQAPRMRVRYRIDGMLFDVLTIPPGLETSIISRIKILADMNITERRLPQDGRLSVRLEDQEYNMRVATIPTALGEKLVMRLLMQSSVLTGLKQLGLEPDDEHRLRTLIARPQGMILVTGPIGSGKTTTLYAALNEVNILTSNIVTIEDPVEYQLAGINQVEVDLKTGLTFASGLRSILRQDADILMVGEIRDIETAIVAVRAALTGQQLFSTLHTTDTPSAITTLENFGIQPYLVGSALSGVVAQRLVRTICTTCRQWYIPSAAVLRQLGLQPEQQEWRFAYGVGCDACYHTGYKGRTGLFEILRVSETLRRLITEQANEATLQTAAVREGMRTLQQSGIQKIIQGVTTPQEVMREVYL